MSRSHVRLLIATVLLVLPGCGAGSGEGEAIVDRERPRIEALRPAPAAEDVAEGAAVEVVFETDLDPATVGPAALQVRVGGRLVPGTVQYDAANRSVVFTPEAPLALGAQVEATVAAGVADLEGNVRAEPFPWAFETRPAAFRGEQPHGSHANATRLLGFAMNPAGDWATVLSEDTGSDHDLWLRARTHEDVPFERRLVTGGDYQTANAALTGTALAPSGKGVAAWVESDAFGKTAYARRFDVRQGTTELTSRTLSTSDDFQAPQVAIGNAGHTVVTWRQASPGPGRYDLYAATFDGIDWSTSVPVEAADGTVETNQVAMNRLGSAAAVWVQDVGDQGRLFARTWRAGPGWGAVEPVEALGNVRCSIIAVDVDLDGHIWVLFTAAALPNGSPDLYMGHYVPPGQVGAGWQTPEPLDTDMAVRPFADMHVASTGVVHAVWWKENALGTRVHSRRHTLAGWEPQTHDVTLDPPLSVDDGNFALAGNPDGGLVVAWRAFVPGGLAEVSVATYVPEQAWIPASSAALTVEDKDKLVVAIDGSLNALVAAVDDPSGDDARIRARRLRGGSLVPGIDEITPLRRESVTRLASSMSTDGRGVLVWQNEDSAHETVWIDEIR